MIQDCASKGSRKWSYLIKEERDDRGWPRSDRVWEAKRAEERRSVEESREECKDGKEMELRNQEKFCRVKVVPVSQFMGKDSFHFLRLRLFDQGVKDDNVFALPKIEPEKRV
jgi:hypothetical protein